MSGSQQQRQRSPIIVARLSGPTVHDWPTCAAFGRVGATAMSPPVFSVPSANEVINTLVQEEAIDGDRAGELSQQVADLGLPAEETRWDKIVRVYRDDSSMAYHLISRLSDALPFEEGSGPARFEACQNGHLCGSKNCKSYPPHGKPFLNGVTDDVAHMVFSSASLAEITQAWLKDGLLDENEVKRVTTEAERSKLARETGRFDALASAGRSQEKFIALLDIVSGITPVKYPAMFRPCGEDDERHVHFVGVDMISLGAPIFSVTTANKAIERELAAGFIDDADAERLRAQLLEFSLPETSPEDERGASLGGLLDEFFDSLPSEMRDALRSGASGEELLDRDNLR